MGTALMRVTVQDPPLMNITETTAEPSTTTLPELSSTEIPARLNKSKIDTILQAVEEDAELIVDAVHQEELDISSYNTTKTVNQEHTVLVLGVSFFTIGLGLVTVGGGILLYIRRRRRNQVSSSVYYDNLQEEE